ncbi:RHS repeat protein [Ramlibacter humi]|uniref:RHS repeat protein n=1 Tax=Ramlibacter humi TaxID=2530451 RepID=UPI00143194B4|nr:RHS repeat protein [Ramlibacter humi]
METYNAAGLLQEIAFSGGKRLAFVYSTASTSADIAPAPGYLTEVRDQSGRSLTFSYRLPAGAAPATGGLLRRAANSQGEAISLTFDGAGNLTQLTNQDVSVKTFLYEISALPWALTGIQNELNVRFATFSYDAAGRAISTEHAGGVEKYSVSYQVAPEPKNEEQYGSAGSRMQIVVQHKWVTPSGIQITDPGGTVRTIGAVDVNGRPQLASNSQPAGSGCSAATSAQTYDSDGNLASRDDFDGHRSCYVQDPARVLTLTKVEGLASDQSCSQVLASGAALPAGSRKISTQWHPDWPLERQVAEPGRIRTFVYNGQPDPTNNNAIAFCAPRSATLPDGRPIAVLCKEVHQATKDSSGAQGFAAELDQTIEPHITEWTYDTRGSVNSIAEGGIPRATYFYYQDTWYESPAPDARGHAVGDLNFEINGVGHFTQFLAYDHAGRLVKSVDPKSSTTEYEYTPRGYVSSVAVTPPGGDPRTTLYRYDATGALFQLRAPDGSSRGYSYDAAGRLVGSSSSQGTRVEYTLDNFGNRVMEQQLGAGGEVIRKITRTFDALNRVESVQEEAQK